jgi:outer membrane protein
MTLKYGMTRFSLAIVAMMSVPQVVWAGSTQSLMDIYRLAQTNDPTLASAQSARLATQEKQVQGRALTLPTVTAGANASHSNSDVEYRGTNAFFGKGSAESFETYGYNVSISHPLYNKANSVQYEQSKTQVTQAEEQLNSARQDLMLRVSQSYFDVLLAQDRIDLIVAQKAAINKQLEQAKANFEVGTSTITDVHEAQARFDLTTAQEIAAVNDLEVKKRTIQSITTQVPQRLATAKSDLQVAIPQPADMESWVELAEQNNIALKVQLQSLQLATQEIDRAHAGHLPTVDVVGSFSDTRANGGVNASSYLYDQKMLSVGLQVQMPLYRGGSINSKEREAAANQQKAQDDVEAVRRQADLQARQAFLNVSSAVAQVKAYEQALTSSQSQLDSTNLGYEVGVRTSVDVLNAQQQLYSAKRDLLQARYTYLLSILNLKAAAGVLLDKDLAEINQLLEGV